MLNISIADVSSRNMSVASATVARSIPGLRNAEVRAPRKPVRSVRLNDSGNESVADVDRHPPREAVKRSLAASLLPLAPDAQHPWRVVLNSVVAYSIVFLSLAIVHIPFVLGAGARSFVHAADIFWADLVSSHLGHLFLYGALVTLLGYTEQFFEKARASVSHEYICIAFKIAFWATVVVGVGLRLCGIAIDVVTLFVLAIVTGAELTAIGALGHCAGAGLAGAAKRSKNVLIVGTRTTAARVAQSLSSAQNSGRVVKGIIGRNYGGSPAVIGTVDQLAGIARAEFIDEIIVAPGDDRDLAERAVDQAVRSHLDVTIVPELFIDSPTSLCMQELGGMPLISVHEEPIPWLGLLLKRVMDVVVSALLLLLLLPWLMVIAAAIKLDSRGPVLYAALRVGRKGRTFRCYKFRTMSPDADRTKDLLRAHNQRLGPTFKIVNDPRITPLGRILRRYSLDELPQLWNVLDGTMSLVGPRPHPLDDYQRYALEDRRRLDVCPGITGLWQVTARDDPSFRTNMALDLEYIEKWSLRMDLSIALKTLPVLLGGTGA